MDILLGIKEGVKYPCRYFGYSTFKEALAQHKRTVHDGVKYPCGQCGHQLTSKGDLVLHKRAVHEGVIEVDFGRKIWKTVFSNV